ncbi:MAG: hypothetical protein R3F13_21840 [Prosthecobacter sp.]
MSRNSRQALLLIFSCTALAVAWGWRLHSEDPRPRNDDSLLESTRAEIAARLSKSPEHLQQAAVFQLTMLPDHEVRALHEWLDDTPEERLRQLTVQQGPVSAPCPLNVALVFAEIARVDAPAVEDVRHLVSASGDRLEEPHKLALLNVLARKADENHESSLAVEIRQRVCESSAATWNDVVALADAAQVARRPAAALKTVNVWLDPSSTRLDPARRDDALDLQMNLLLQGTRYAEASRIVLDELRSLGLAEAIPVRLLERALLATRAAGESAELLPWIERHLRTFADHKISVEDIAAGKPLSVDYLRWLDESASIADSQHHGSIACDDYLRLAAAGEIRVLARLHALALQTGRGQEFAGLLVALQKRFSVLELAAALVEGDAPAPARSLLTVHLKNAPKNRAAWRLLTEIDVRVRGESSASILWLEFLKRFPDDVPAMRHLAQLQVERSQLPQALRTLQQIPGENLDEATLRQIAALAIQLDDLSTAQRAQHLLVQGSKSPAVADLRTLAALTRQNHSADSEALLAGSIAKLPAAKSLQQSLLPVDKTAEGSAFSTATRTKSK